MLESLVRLSQAHAKLCCRSTVEVLDAVVVVDTMENSIDGAAGDMGESE
jgi:DNA replicative helicase MCM subunit Mcm2 (Cdc46/Mcm family)|eukprot:SAG25_NODE_10782_length_322_cov_2.753363_1_plen_49_part_00